MELVSLIEALRQPAAYPFAVGHVDVRQTHISVVFLAGSHAYKLKKPVNLGFLDFSTLEKRRHFCEEEVRLNRRLAPDVYLGVVSITQDGAGLQMEGTGTAVECAVKMERLPEDATLQQRLRRGEVDAPLVEELAQQVAVFHARAEGGAHIAAFGRFEVVAQNARENFAQATAQIGATVSAGVFARLREHTEQALARLQPLIERRAERGVPRDTHGDLHLDHVYLFPERQPPADVIIVDCIEFNERFRFADPVADMAFLVMDLAFHGRRDLARAFADAYFRAAGDDEGRALLPFYTAYRAAVRAKVEGMESMEREVPAAEREAVARRARAHWLLALTELAERAARPCLVLVSGLPGTGKSSLSRALADAGRFTILRSDVVRKELCGASSEDIYTPEWTQRTYTECLRRAQRLLLEGQRVLVDATFQQNRRRVAFLQAALDVGMPAVFLVCRADPAIVRERLARRRGDVSDADWSVYQMARAHWEEPSPFVARFLHTIATDGETSGALDPAVTILRKLGLW